MATKSWSTGKRDDCRFCYSPAINIVKTPGGFVRVCDEHIERVPTRVNVTRLHLKADTPSPACPFCGSEAKHNRDDCERVARKKANAK